MSGLDTKTVGADDRGYLYGDALFETVVVRAHRARWLADHARRFEQSARWLGFCEPFIERAVSALRSLLERPDGVWRLSASRADEAAPWGGRGSLRARRRPLPAPAEPPALCGAPGLYLPDDPIAEHKTANYLRPILAKRRAQAEGFDDAIMISADGLIGDASAASVLIRFGAQIAAPALRGILPGVTRRRVIERLARRGLKVSERAVRAEELEACDEIVLLSSVRGAVSAASWRGRALDRELGPELSAWIEASF